MGAKLSKNIRTIAFDPGIRTLLTGYDLYDESILEFGNQSYKKLFFLFQKRARIQSQLALHMARIKTEDESKLFVKRLVKRRRIKRKAKLEKLFAKLSYKMENLVNDCHKKIAK